MMTPNKFIVKYDKKFTLNKKKKKKIALNAI